MVFLTNSEYDIEEMLKQIGVKNFEELIANIPNDLRFKGSLNIPNALSELQVSSLIESYGNKNQLGVSFLGGGVYDHYIPAVINTIISRPEFYTAYTPYQPEVSQGTLQAIYEFQSMISELTAMDVTNASMYEGGSALAEAMLLACNHTKKRRVLLPETLNYRYRNVLQAYISHNDIEIDVLPARDFQIDLDTLNRQLNDDVAAVIIQHPNYYGYLEPVFDIAALLQDKEALFIACYDPISLGLLAPPGEFGADIAIAEGQSLGIRQSFGGPFMGLFSTRQEFIRKIPGRLAGFTTDMDGIQGFVLTLQTREQHIRREKATSNICTNSGLLALAATVYLALMGKTGIKNVANLCLQKSHYLAQQLGALSGVKAAAEHSFFKEFVVEFPIASQKILQQLREVNILGGISLHHLSLPQHLLISVTEKRTCVELDNYILQIKRILNL
jgi:glycine dehydrogenase subunit 1